MNPTVDVIFEKICSGRLVHILRGEEDVFSTPSNINADMRPTDHNMMLELAMYPLAAIHGAGYIQRELEKAVRELLVDARGLYCAVQLYYVEILGEDANASPLRFDRRELPKLLLDCFFKQSKTLHELEIEEGDLMLDRPYRLTLSRLRILGRDHRIDWGVALP
jgi:hypothetical protein